MHLVQPELSDVRELATFHRMCWQSAYRGVCDQAWLDSLSIEQFEGYHRPHLSKPATDPDQPFLIAIDDESSEKPRRIIGFARGGPTRTHSPTGDVLPNGIVEPYSAELYALYIHPQQQGKGIGRAMFAAIVEAFRSRGHKNMCLWALTANVKAQDFYRSRGGRSIGNAMMTFGGTLYDMTAYVWDQI